MEQRDNDDEAPAGDVIRSAFPNALTREEGLARLDALTQDVPVEDWAESEVLDAIALAHRIGAPTTVIEKWLDGHQILALPRAEREDVYPLRQFEGGLPIAGLAEVRAHFECDETTWEWLIGTNRYTGGEYPIEWLRKGHIQDVVRAAEGAWDFQ